MEEIINKPDSQFKDILNDLIDYSKDSEEKSALIKEVCLARHPTKPAASLNSSIYSSAASSSSSTSSASDSSTNSASSSSTSSTLSSPSQSNQGDSDANNSRGSSSSHQIDNMEVAKMEDLGKTARILEHRLAITNEFRTAETGNGKVAVTASHSYNRSISLNSKSPLPSSSANLSQSLTHDSSQQTSITHVTPWGPEPWKTISGKRDKRRRKPVEHPVLSQHIPGHKGEQDVEWLVKFIESGPSGPSNISSSTSKKITKNTKPQSRKLPSQTMERERENHQRKQSNKLTTTHIRPLQQVSGSDQTNTSTQLQSTIQRKGQTISSDSQTLQSEPQKTAQEPSSDRKNECKEPKIICTDDPHREKGSRQDEPVVTFADHICISDDEASSNGKYIFGFFDEQQPQANNQAEDNKQASKLNEDPQNSSKPKRVSQKHKLKHPKASLNSEQKRYKLNDNIDANSFNYHQILEFISNSWESTAKSRRQTVKHAGSS